jgi:uncharacterized protein YggT (Ycf19 family)
MAHEVVKERVIVRTAPVTEEPIIVRRVLYYILDVIELLLLTRFVLKIFGANSRTPFVGFMYQLTEPLVAPFRGIFPPVAEQGLVIEWATVVAMIVYALLTYLIIRLIYAFTD